MGIRGTGFQSEPWIQFSLERPKSIRPHKLQFSPLQNVNSEGAVRPLVCELTTGLFIGKTLIFYFIFLFTMLFVCAGM